MASTTVPGPEKTSGTSSEGVGDGDQIHPLLIEVVKTRLFSYLDVPTLKLARLVCKPWNETAEPLLLEKGVAVLDGFRYGDMLARMQQIGRLLASMGQTPELTPDEKRYANYVWIQAQWLSNDDHDMNSFQIYFSVHGRHVKSLKLPPPGCQNQGEVCYFNVKFLDAILKACVNLEELEMTCPGDDFLNPETRLNCQKCALKTIIIHMENGIHKELLQNLISACPGLKTFVLKYNSSTGNTCFVEDLFQLGETGRIKLDKLDSLDISADSILLTSKAALKSMCSQKLNLSVLALTLDTRFEGSDMVQEGELMLMFHHLCHSLRSLVLYNYPGTLPLNFDVMIPPTMTRLETVEIRTGTNVFMMGPLKSAVNLPSLKTLILYRMPTPEIKGFACPEVEYDFTQCWSSLGGGWFTKRHDKLEVLQLPCGFITREHLLDLAAVFPNLRDLRLQNPSLEVIATVFMVYTQLEKLSIRMKEFPIRIDSTLTGLSPKICAAMAKKDKYKFADPNQVQNRKAGLHYMKNLKYFELKQWFNSLALTEVTLWHGLIHLERAIQLDLNGCQRFSDRSIAALKTALGPTCFVNIETHLGHHDNEHFDRFWSRRIPRDRKY